MDPSRLKLQLEKHAEKHDFWVLGTPAVKGVQDHDNRPLILGIPAPNLGQQNLTSTTARSGSSQITQDGSFAGCSYSVSKMPINNAMHNNVVPRPGVGHLIRPPFGNLPAGYSQVPINILVLHKRPAAAADTRPSQPLPGNVMLAAALNRGSNHLQDSTSPQLAPNHFLMPGRASSAVSNDMAFAPPAPATPDKCKIVHGPTCFQQCGLVDQVYKAATGREPGRPQHSPETVDKSGSTKPEAPVTPAKAEGMQGSMEDSMQKYQRMRKRIKSPNSDDPDFSTSAAISNGQLQVQTSIMQQLEIDKVSPGQKQKQRRKKHRPKVIREGKPDKTPKPATATANQMVKRTYVRKKRSLSSLDNPSGPVMEKSSSAGGGMTAESSNTSVRRKLDFECKERAMDRNAAPMINTKHHDTEKPTDAQGPTCSTTKSTVQLGQGLQLEVENSSAGFVFDLNRSLSRMLDEYMCLPEAATEATPEVSGCFSRAVLKENLRELAMKHNKVNSIHNPSDSLTEMSFIEYDKKDVEWNSFGIGGVQINSADETSSDITFSHDEITKRALLGKQWVHEWQNTREVTSAGPQGMMISRTAAEMLAFCQAGGIKKKRSVRARKPSSLPSKDLENKSSQPSYRSPQSCMEALFESSHIKVTTKKRTQKARVHSLGSILSNLEYKERVSTGSIFSGRSIGPSASQGNFQRTNLPWTVISLMQDNKKSNHNIFHELSQRSLQNTSAVPFVDCLQSTLWKLKNLDLDAEQVDINAPEQQHALVPYGGRTMVMYEDPWHIIKKRRPRAKVNLDDETNRVWKLLMGKEANPVEGTDAEKERWWEQERQVFQGRANSFIARMRLVQGDRQFSPWKGSVVDSVVGVFLTQNVADHLSSSAFMALAAKFPPKPKSSDSKRSEGIMSMQAVQDDSILALGDPIRVESAIGFKVNSELLMTHEKVVNESIKDSNSLYRVEASVGSLHGQQETEMALGTQEFALNFSIELAGSTNRPQEIQFQEDIASTQSVFTSETIDQLYLSSGTDHAPGNFPANFGAQELGNNCNDGMSSAGNNAAIDEDTCQGIGMTTKNDEIHQPNGAPKSIAYTPIPAVDHPQLDARNESCVSSTSPNSSSSSESVNMKNEIREKSNYHFMPFNAYATMNNSNRTADGTFNSSETSTYPPVKLHQEKKVDFETSDSQEYESSSAAGGMLGGTVSKVDEPKTRSGTSSQVTPETPAYTSKPRKTRAATKNAESVDWDSLRRQVCSNGYKKDRSAERHDSLDWEAVRCANVNEISHAIRERGMNNVLAERIQNFLNRLVKDHGSIDLEWLRDIPPDKAKDYLLSIRGLGLKSVECVRLLTLHHLAFPVDTNVGRICVRLGWVPLQPLPESLQLHLLELYPVLETIQKYLWPRLCRLDQRTLYELHYQMITFGKVFCTKNKPNCNACPMRSECKHFASAFASARLALPAPEEKSLVSSTNPFAFQNGFFPTFNSTPRPQLEGSNHTRDLVSSSEPIIEEPASPREEEYIGTLENEIEDLYEDSDEIPTIKLNMEAFAQNIEDCIKENSKELQTEDIAKALVAISSEAASIPVPKLKNVNRLRTEHYVYELPDSHPLMRSLELDQREPDDPTPYLLIIWMPDEIAEISRAQKPCGNSEIESNLCNDGMCHNCVSEQENQARFVRGTILIPCRTAMKGSFPLNGTYFQVNEVFAEHNSSYNPIIVPREQLWNLQRRIVYFGTSVPTIFKGLTTEEIQHCFWRGFVCVRGFDLETRAPKPLCPQLHLVASKMPRSRKTATTGQK